jgi:hypothetical protein
VTGGLDVSFFHRQVLLCFTGHNRGGAASLHGRHRQAGMQGICLYRLSSGGHALVHWSVCVCVLHQAVFQDPNQAVHARPLHWWSCLEECALPWRACHGG